MIGVAMSVGRYAKFVVAAGIAALTVLASAITDGNISDGEWVQIALAGLGAVGVYLVPNKSA